MSPSNATHLCRKCGSAVEPRVEPKVNAPVAFILFVCGIVPGVLYLLWGMSQEVLFCPVCETKDTVIPIDSPEAKRQLRALSGA